MSVGLEVLEPAPVEVGYRGERLEIRPLTIGQIPKVVRLAKPIITTLFDSVEGDDASIVEVLLDLVGDHGEAAFQAAAFITGWPAEWIEGGDPAEFVDLVQAIYSVNADFFVQRLAPLLAGWAGLGAEKTTGGGQTSSNSSSSAATP